MSAAIAAHGVVLTPEAALKRAVAVPQVKAMSTSSAATPVLVYTEEIDNVPAVYLFDRGHYAGYLIVAADDEMVPLLGYADAGTIDTAEMPDGLKYWLGYYAAEIDNVRHNGAEAVIAEPAATSRKAIAPMVSTRWNQSAPYNAMCPRVGSSRCVTGCVATAMAQIMKYHNWPEKGRGSNSYSWNGQTLSQDFSTVTYDWDNMLDEYGLSATAVQNEAVATLMYSCGVSVDMSYGTGVSGAISMKCGNVLVEYFNYDASLRYLVRDYFTLSQWEDEVYASLASGCPVLYGGQSTGGGHEFVCDGYSSDGYFHFNWGWGGMSDGYFRLTALNPGSQGIGGAGSGAGYNFNQDIIVGIRPYAGQSEFTPALANTTDFSIDLQSAPLGSDVSATIHISNISYVDVTYKLGLAFTDASGNTVYSLWPYTNTLSLKSGYSYNSPVEFDVAVPATLADGVYTVAPAFLSGEKWYVMETKIGKVGSVTMTVSNGIATFASPEAGVLPHVTGYSFANTLYSGKLLTVNGTVENTGDLESYETAYGAIMGSSGNTLLAPIQFDLQSGQSVSFEYSGTIPASIAAGDYQFAFVVKTSDGYTPISDITDITVKTAPASVELTLGPVSFATGSNHVPCNDLGVKTTLTCKTGIYYGTLSMVVFRQTSATQWSSCAEFPSQMLYLEAGDTADIVYNSDFSNGNIGETYLLMFYYGNNRFNTQEMIVLDESAGVTDVAISEDEVDVELYNLQGQRISGNPSAGHYIMVKRTPDGKASSRHLIIK